MKHLKAILTATLLGSSPVAIHAQDSDYRPMLIDGREWITVHTTGGNEYSSVLDTKYLKVIGDTIVNNKTCKKISSKFVSSCENDDYDNVFYGTMVYYEHDKIVYNVTKNEKGKIQFSKLLDFNLKVGDVLKWGNYRQMGASDLVVLAEDYVIIDGNKHRRMIIGHKDGTELMRWVEGIGENGSTSDLMYIGEIYYARTKNLSFSQDGRVIFTYDDFFKDSEQTAVIEVTTEPETADDAPCYDLLGRRVANPRPGSTVIRAGRLLRL